MLAIRPSSKTKKDSSSSTKKFTPNLLPCRINHTSSIRVEKRYWDPKTMVREGKKDGELTSYFRGRKLLGRKVKVPEGYRGVVVREGEVLNDGAVNGDGNGEEEEDEEKEIETKIMEEMGSFDEVTVWGHEGVSDVGGEGVIRGMEEWISWCGAIHDCGDEEE